jgi:O-antigen/teichoic acid export membrane protein
LDQLLIASFKGATALAPYALSWKLAAMIHLPGLAAACVITPRLVQASSGAKEMFAYWLKLLAVVYVGLTVTAAALSPELFHLIGFKYRNDSSVFRALSGYFFLMGIAPLVSMACNFLGEARGRLPVAFLSLGVNLGLDLLLIPPYGVYGAAFSTSISFLLYVTGHLRLLHRRIGPWPPWHVRSLLTRVTVAAIFTGLLARILVQQLSSLGWLGLGLCSSAVVTAYVSMMLPVLRVAPQPPLGRWSADALDVWQEP